MIVYGQIKSSVKPNQKHGKRIPNSKKTASQTKTWKPTYSKPPRG